jgi:hypothetical protein
MGSGRSEAAIRSPLSVGRGVAGRTWITDEIARDQACLATHSLEQPVVQRFLSAVVVCFLEFSFALGEQVFDRANRPHLRDGRPDRRKMPQDATGVDIRCDALSPFCQSNVI